MEHLDERVNRVHKLSSDDVLVQVGDFIRHERDLTSKTRVDLASDAGVHVHTLDRIEAGGNTGFKTLVKVIYGLGYDYEGGVVHFFADANDYDSGRNRGKEP